MNQHNAIIIGSGQAGNPLASFLVAEGLKVLLVEKDRLGGTCVNTGCTPSKTFHEAIRKIHHARNLAYAGFKLQDTSFDFARLMEHSLSLGEKSRSGMADSFAEKEGLSVARGHARFLTNKSIRITDREGRQSDHQAEKIYINVGSYPRLPDIKGLSDVPYLTNLNLWELREKPRSLLIVGGGYLGVEFAQSYARLGCEVHLIHRESSILEKEDEDIRDEISELLKDEGVQIHLNQEAERVSQTSAGKLQLQLQRGLTLEGEHLLIAVGRLPATQDLGLENSDLALNKDGSLAVNEFLETNVDGVYALGEVAGSPQFTHMVYDDFRVVRDNFRQPSPSASTRQRQLPYCLFCDPQLASFGYNESRAKAAGKDYYLYEMPMKHFSRAAEKHETRGKAKVLCDKEGGKIIGASILGAEAGELVSLLQVAAQGGLTANDLKDFIFGHPLLSEGLNNLFA